MTRIRWSSLRVRLVLLVLLAVLPALGVLLYSGLKERSQSISDAKLYALNQARNLSKLQERIIDNVYHVLFTLSQIPGVQDRDSQVCSAILASLLKESEEYAGFIAADPAGVVFASAPPTTSPTSFSDRPWYQPLLASRSFIVGGYQMGRISGKPVLSVAYPVLDAAGQLAVILGAGLDLNWLNQLMGEVKLPDGATCTITDQTGTLLARYPDSGGFVGKSLPEAAGFKAMINRDEGTTEALGLDGVPRVYGFSSLHSGGGVLYMRVGIPKQVAFAKANEEIALHLAVVTLVSILALTAAWHGGDAFIIRQLNKLLQVIGDLGAGNLTARVGAPYSAGEVGAIAHAFDQMVELLERRETERTQAVEALRESEERFRQTAENIREVLWMANAELTRVIYVSPAYEEVYGRSCASLHENPGSWIRAIHPEDRKRVADTLSGQDGGGFALEYRVVRPDETVRWIWDQGFPIRNEAGEICRFTGIAEDITERKQAEMALRSANRALKLLSNCNHILVRAPDEQHLLQEVCALVVKEGGYRFAWVGFPAVEGSQTISPVAWAGQQGEFRGKMPMGSADTQQVHGPCVEAMRTGKPVIVSNVFADQDCAACREEAEKRGFASIIGLPLVFDGRVLGCLALYVAQPNSFGSEEMALLTELADDLAFGITSFRIREERRLAEQSLQERERYYRSLLVNLYEDILVVDRDYQIADTGKDLMLISGSHREQMIGRKCYEVSHGATEPCANLEEECPLSRVFQTGKAESVRHEHQHVDGSKVWVDILFSPLRDESGRITHVIEAMRDVTPEVEMRGMLRQAQKMQAIGTLAGGIAHDFNNILGVILGYTEITLLTGSLESSVDSNLQKVLQAAYRAKDLVKQILTFSRQGEQERKPLTIIPIVKEVLKLLRAALPSSIELRQRFDELPQGADIVMADSTQIHQVLMNLCTNAGHAMRENGGVIQVTLSAVEFCQNDFTRPAGLNAGSFLRLTVSDSGHGMDQEVLERIFEPYFTTKGPGEGTGLGLSMVHGIVTGHGGAITVHSKLGQGTSFHVYLPRLTSETPKQEAKSPLLPRGSATILFVDDEPALADAGKMMLEYLGYKVVARTSSFEALQDFRAHPEEFDLVVTDLTMPQMTGLDLAKELLCTRPGIPVILCTGFSNAITAEKAKTLGIREVIMKPLILNEVAKVIHNTLHS